MQRIFDIVIHSRDMIIQKLIIFIDKITALSLSTDPKCAMMIDKDPKFF